MALLVYVLQTFFRVVMRACSLFLGLFGHCQCSSPVSSLEVYPGAVFLLTENCTGVLLPYCWFLSGSPPTSRCSDPSRGGLDSRPLSSVPGRLISGRKRLGLSQPLPLCCVASDSPWSLAGPSQRGATPSSVVPGSSGTLAPMRRSPRPAPGAAPPLSSAQAQAEHLLLLPRGTLPRHPLGLLPSHVTCPTPFPDWTGTGTGGDSPAETLPILGIGHDIDVFNITALLNVGDVSLLCHYKQSNSKHLGW